MGNRFSKFVNGAPPCTPNLPLMHTTPGSLFSDIADERALRTESHEDRFDGEALLYLFYGRPVYRPEGENSSKDAVYKPICIVLTSDAVDRPIRVFPFDTGAYHRGMFYQFLPEPLGLDHYTLRPSMDMPAKLVGMFYPSNRRYYDDQPSENLEIPVSQPEARRYYDMLCFKGVSQFDDRCGTAEIQSNRALKLTRDNVLLVVAPQSFLKDEKLRELVTNGWGAELRVYRDTPRWRPNEHLPAVFEKVREFLEERGYI